MKQFYKKLATLVAALLLTILPASAYDFLDGRLYYTILSEEDRKVEVADYDDRFAGAQTITIPKKVIYNSETYTVTSIGVGAFCGYRSLTSVEIPASVTAISAEAFYDCSGLTSVEIPASVTSIEDGVFGCCSSLTSIEVENGNKSYISLDGVLFNKDKTSLLCLPAGKTGAYAIPASVTSIVDHAFCGCSSLTSVEIPASVTSIGAGAFVDCSGLTSVEIPNSVTSIGDYAFSGCESLTSVYCHADAPPTCGDALFEDKALLYGTLYVPKGTGSAYEAVDPWRYFWNIVEMDFPDVTGITSPTKDMSIACENGSIKVNGISGNPTVRVYSTQGSLVAETREGVVSGLPAGVYVVSVNGKSFRVAVR